VKLPSSSKSEICDRCRKADADADFEAHQRGLSFTYEFLRYDGNPKAHFELLKRNFVAQKLASQGRLPEAIREIRTRWGINPLAQLPQSEDIPYPPGVEELIGSKEPYAAYADLKERLRGGRHYIALLRGDLRNLHYISPPGDPEELHTIYSNLKTGWHTDLHWVLLCGGVPEKYLEKPPPYVGNPPISTQLLPWYRFAAGCVLYDVPRLEDALAFAEYGGLPPLPGEEAEEEPILGVLTERQLREERMMHDINAALDELILEKMWELRSELGEDPRRARYEIMGLFPNELYAEETRVREEYQLEMELNPPRRYYIEVVPGETREKAVCKRFSAIWAKEKDSPKSKNPPDNLGFAPSPRTVCL